MGGLLADGGITSCGQPALHVSDRKVQKGSLFCVVEATTISIAEKESHLVIKIG